MARNVRTYIGDSPTDEDSRPKHLTKQEFGRRLYRLMNNRGWNQSDLARAADITRDAASTYIRGKSLPGPRNLKKLAVALGITEQELLPNQIEQAIDRDPPAFSIQISVSNPKVAWVRVNRLMSTVTGLKIAELLNADETPDAS